MGIANVIEFGGVSSDVFDVVIEGAGEYTAPKRAFESISIPGRNGAFVLDKGYYENVDGKFKVVIQAATQLEFQRKVRDFKNAIVSQRGYQRLTEQYQPDTYRMATYKSGFDEEPKFIGNAAVFTLTFDCQPQRYWMDGETPIEVSDGDAIFNPTMFEAQPMLEAEGYGLITMNGYDISIANALMGEVVVGEASDNTSGAAIVQSLDANLYNAGDDLTIQPFRPKVRYKKKSGVTNVVLGDRTNCTASKSGDYITVTLYPDPETFASSGDNAFYISGTVELTYEKGGSGYAVNMECKVYVQYDATNHTITYSSASTAPSEWLLMTKTMASGEVIADSSVSALGSPTYIDCDIGDVYKFENDSYASLNKYIDLGSKLPELSPGNNEITFDNTITSLAVVPRWWEV